jgi:catechol 2,3-dioxygenase-like lactoylglutathione lyase family enzyme
MALHPTGVHHLALSTTDITAQIEFFTDVLGGELKALYWMHGVKDAIHGFVELSPTCYIAFVQQPANTTRNELGVTHAGNAGGPMPGGTMQHLALAVDSVEELLAMRDRIRSRGIVAVGPFDHGLCRSIYFAGPEGLCLEVACGGDIDERAWIDPGIVKLLGIDPEDLEHFKNPAPYEPSDPPLAQPTPDPAKPNLVYPPAVYRRIVETPDERFWHAVDSNPPVRLTS